MPELLLQYRRHLLAATVALALLLLAARLLLPAGTTTPAAPLPPSPGLGASATGAPRARAVVDVVGAVRRPGNSPEDPRLPPEARSVQLGRRARRRARDRAQAARPASRSRRPVSSARHSPHVFVAALCLGMASANVARLPLLGAAVGAALL